MKFKKIYNPTLYISFTLAIAFTSIPTFAGAVPSKNDIYKNQISYKTISNDIKPAEINTTDVYNDNELIAGEDMYKGHFERYWSGKKYSDKESGITVKNANIDGSYTVFNVNIKSDFEFNVKFNIINNSDNFKVVFITPDNRVTTIAESGEGTQKLHLSKGRNRIKFVGKNDSSVEVDLKFNIAEMDELLKECTDFKSMVFLLPYCSENINTYMSDYINSHSNFDLNNLNQIAPYLKKDALDKYVRKILDRGNKMDAESIRVLAPYLSSDTVAFFIQKAIDEQMDVNIIRNLAPYVSKENIDSFIDKLIIKNEVDSNIIQSLAPYANQKSIDESLLKHINSVNSNAIRYLAPYASKKGISDFIVKYADISNINFELVRYIAPYANQESIDDFITKILLNKKSNFTDIQYLIPYASNLK